MTSKPPPDTARTGRKIQVIDTRVLVLDASTRQALAACRALGRAGYEVGTAGYTGTELAGHSRWSTRYHLVANPADDEAFHDVVTRIVSRYGYHAVVATDDATIARLSSHAPAVPTIPELGAGAALADKLGLAAVAKRAGVAYPTTIVAESPGEIPGIVRELGPTLVLKASASAAVVGARVEHVPGALITADLEVARRSVMEMNACGVQALAQQHVPRRAKIDVVIVRSAGRSVVRLVYDVVRDIPLTGGLAVSMETISPDRGIGKEAVESLERVVDEAGYEGVANGEFAISADDGRLYLIEVNPRLWASSWFGERLGQRIAERCVLHALGREQPPLVPVPVGRRFHHPVGEARWIALHERRVAPALAVLRDLRPWDVFEYDEYLDPRPLAALAQSLRRRRAT